MPPAARLAPNRRRSCDVACEPRSDRSDAMDHAGEIGQPVGLGRADLRCHMQAVLDRNFSVNHTNRSAGCHGLAPVRPAPFFETGQRIDEDGGDMAGAPFEKDRCDTLLKLVEHRFQRRLERSQYEWKLSFGVWALIVSSTIYFNKPPPEWLLVLGLTMIFLFHSLFVLEVRNRNRLDTEMAFYYIDLCEEMLSILPGTPRIKPDYERSMSWKPSVMFRLFWTDFWWTGIEIAITLLLSLSSYWLIGTIELRKP